MPNLQVVVVAHALVERKKLKNVKQAKTMYWLSVFNYKLFVLFHNNYTFKQ